MTQPFDAAARPLVEEALRKLGLTGDLCRARQRGDDGHDGHDGQQQTSWTLKRGSAAILVSLVLREGEVVLRVLSPVMKPAPERKAELFAHLLDLNAAGLGPCSFGRVGELVVLVSERPSHDLSALEVEHIIRHLAAVADKFDDKLVTDFGGSRASDTH